MPLVSNPMQSASESSLPASLGMVLPWNIEQQDEVCNVMLATRGELASSYFCI